MIADARLTAYTMPAPSQVSPAPVSTAAQQESLRARLRLELLRGRPPWVGRTAPASPPEKLPTIPSVVDYAPPHAPSLETQTSQARADPKATDIEWSRAELPVPDPEHCSQNPCTVPMLIAQLTEWRHSGTSGSTAGPAERSRPAIVLLHGTGGSADGLAPHMAWLLRRTKSMIVAPDSRHHGRRCQPKNGSTKSGSLPDTSPGPGFDANDRQAHQGPPGKSLDDYQSALVEAWRNGGRTRPFAYDTAADMGYVADYLLSRRDVSSIAIIGISLGGIHSWLAGASDERWAAVVPMIGVQSFLYAVENSCAGARIATIPHVFAAAAGLDTETMLREMRDDDSGEIVLGRGPCGADVRRVWDCICPGLLELYDAEHTLPLIAPRPLFVANGKYDPRCPVDGLNRVWDKVRQAYSNELSCNPQNFRVKLYDCAHEVTDEMWCDVADFLLSALHSTTC